jgi:hypothetical protein
MPLSTSRKSDAEQPVLLAYYNFQEVTEKSTVLYCGGENSLGRNFTFGIANQRPKIWPHKLQPSSDELGQTLSCGRVTGL